MATLRLIAAAIALSLLLSPPTRSDDAKETKAPSFLTCALARGGDRETVFGLCNGCVLLEEGRPIACFGVNKRPKEKGRYLYLILFRAPVGGQADFKVAGSGNTNADRALRDDYVVLGGKKIELAYQFAADEKSHALVSEALKVGGKEVKEGDPRVFLVDLTQDKVNYESVKVDLPDAVPDLKDDDKKEWAATLHEAIDQLKKKSPRIAKFLEEKVKD